MCHVFFFLSFVGRSLQTTLCEKDKSLDLYKSKHIRKADTIFHSNDIGRSLCRVIHTCDTFIDLFLGRNANLKRFLFLSISDK